MSDERPFAFGTFALKQAKAPFAHKQVSFIHFDPTEPIVLGFSTANFALLLDHVPDSVVIAGILFLDSFS